MKRILSMVLLFLLLIQPCDAEMIGVSASAAVLLDCNSGEVLYEKNADKQMRIASTTKIMTALVALDCARLDEVTMVTDRHMVEGSSMYLKPGETVTVEELLYGLLLCSGNDAALCLAEHCSGSIENFVAMMNEKAAVIGMENTCFENPNGLDGENHHSTARDMALLAQFAANDPTFCRLCSTKIVHIGERTMSNHNKLLGQLDGCIGMKTGYTKAAGRTLVSCCERDGRRLVAVTLCDGDDWNDHERLYEWGFAASEK